MLLYSGLGFIVIGITGALQWLDNKTHWYVLTSTIMGIGFALTIGGLGL